MNINSIIILEIEETTIPEILFLYLSETEKQDFVKIASLNRQKQFLYSKVLLKKIASKLLNIDFKELSIAKDKNGKPFFADYNELYFSLTHSKNMIVLAFSDEVIGIDVEKNEIRNVKIAKRFFSKAEQNYIYQNQDLANQRFLEIWTKKEAYIKYLGESVAYLNKFCVFDLKENLFFSEEKNYFLSIYTKKQKTDFNFYRLSETKFLEVCS
ncbi:MAG: 4'-phosphopantetheinyl transferase superfamily protein [Defluviitaleaceae bacterium]|nr:4'-phosphopantetheinyl transferase superfamily protein [Defluviitaleaceae bacterium]